jgi:hypothetical protein
VHGAGGNGGVEAYWLCDDGSKVGYQAKFHLKSAEIDWAKIDNSVSQALNSHPELRCYVIAIPCDLTDITGKRRKGRTGLQAWTERKAKWESQAAALERSVKFVRWGLAELHDFLTDPDLGGLVAYWFDRLRFDPPWFKKQLDRAIADLDERYHPKDHVDVVATTILDGLLEAHLFDNA